MILIVIFLFYTLITLKLKFTFKKSTNISDILLVMFLTV